MNKIVKSDGRYLVEGAGFTATAKNLATRLTEDGLECIQECLKRLGISFSLEDAPADKSFGVCYVRGANRNDDGTVSADSRNPSRRRFATREEAQTHGNRFHVRKASWQAAPGSAGHVGFYVIETNDPVNAVVNPRTGLTNPAPGYVRPGRDRRG